MPTCHSRFFPPFRAHCLAYDGAEELFQWDSIVFKTRGKLLSVVGTETPLRVTLKADPDRFEALIGEKGIEKAAYVGRFKWITVETKTDRDLKRLLRLTDRANELIHAGAGKNKRGAGTRKAAGANAGRNPFDPGGDPGEVE